MHERRQTLGWMLMMALAGCGGDSGSDAGDQTDGTDMDTSDGSTGPADGDTQTDGGDTGTTGTDGGTGQPVGTVGLEQVADGLVAPTAMSAAPDGTMVVLDQPGKAYRLTASGLELFADLEDRVVALDDSYDERGLLGLAFHPDYPSENLVYVYYSAPLRAGAPGDWDHTQVLSEFQVGDSGMLDLATEREVLAEDWPYSNHDGGTIMFGPDDLLYVTFGDGGNRNDIGRGHPDIGNGQDWTTLLGAILRIDPAADGGEAYGIPADNPFVDDEGADEIWAYGFRNAYAFAFDPQTGDLFAGDAGQNLVEEVDLVEKGQNYGWNIKEGTLCFDPESANDPPEDCADTGAQGNPLQPPILSYIHPNTDIPTDNDVRGVAVVGGRVYRGDALPDLDGVYVFGDWSRSFNAPEGVLLAGRREGGQWSLGGLQLEGGPSGHIGHFIRAFGQDADGEVYVLTSGEAGPTGDTGKVWKIIPASG